MPSPRSPLSGSSRSSWSSRSSGCSSAVTSLAATAYVFYEISLFSLVASMRFAAMAAGRRPGWALPLAAAAIVHVVILALLR